jgi:hypothetical protein
LDHNFFQRNYLCLELLGLIVYFHAHQMKIDFDCLLKVDTTYEGACHLNHYYYFRPSYYLIDLHIHFYWHYFLINHRNCVKIMDNFVHLFSNNFNSDHLSLIDCNPIWRRTVHTRWMMIFEPSFLHLIFIPNLLSHYLSQSVIGKTLFYHFCQYYMICDNQA